MSMLALYRSHAEDQSVCPAVQLSCECILQELAREASTTLYEVARSISYPTASAHLSIRVTGACAFGSIAFRHEVERRASAASEKKRNQHHDRV
jgi:hypothetical protein